MERITNVRISSLSKAVSGMSDIYVESVYLSGGSIYVKDIEGNIYNLAKMGCGCSTPRANVIATLLRGVDGKDGKDGKTQDLSEYYKKSEVDGKLKQKQDTISNLDTIRANAEKGATAVQPSELAEVATSGSYNDLNDKPTIPSAVTESTVSGWGFTKNTGNYTKPSSGIPQSDLTNDVQKLLNQVGNKQDNIEDLEDIRDGAEKGASSIQGVRINETTFTPDAKGVINLGTIGGGEINTMINASWERLVSARDNGELIPGTYYRIIDYVTTTTQENTDSAGNLFDVIVLALDEHTLSEEAYAIQSERDTEGYFANSNLSAWKLWYCLDNDTSRFAWADETNGTGVIYRMIDEFKNDCPYDFKNILFTRYELEAPDEYFTDNIENKWLEQYATNVRAMFDIKEPSFVWAGLQLSDYYWEDEYGEVFSQVTMERKRFYTFSDITDFENKEETSDASLTSNTHNNKIGYTEGILPNNVFFGENCYSNSFGTNCTNNSIGNWASYNTFGNTCYNNTFGNSSSNNKLYSDCLYIIFSNYCYSNTFDRGNYSNSLGENCQSNVFGQNSYCNSFGVSCYNNIFSNTFTYNSFFMNCCDNRFGNSCSSNILSNECNYNNFGNNCYANRFGAGHHYIYNTFGDGVQYLHLTTDEPGYYDNVVQNYHIANGIQGTSEEPLVINAERNRNYETTIARNSNGEIVELCLADFPSLIVKTLNTPV